MLFLLDVYTACAPCFLESTFWIAMHRTLMRASVLRPFFPMTKTSLVSRWKYSLLLLQQHLHSLLKINRKPTRKLSLKKE